MPCVQRPRPRQVRQRLDELRQLLRALRVVCQTDEVEDVALRAGAVLLPNNTERPRLLPGAAKALKPDGLLPAPHLLDGVQRNAGALRARHQEALLHDDDLAQVPIGVLRGH